MTRAHFTHKYLLSPQHPISVNLIGAGGTGSAMLSCLGRLDATLAALDHPGLHVTMYDPDIVDEPNIGRQKFSPADVGLNKAECLITRANAFLGTNWEAVPAKYPTSLRNTGKEQLANIFITCTDNITSRYELAGCLKAIAPAEDYRYVDYETPLYWLDCGNTRNTGQAVLGTVPSSVDQPRSEKYEVVGSLPNITDMPGYNGLTDEDSGPSCSHAEALASQDLFINSTLAELAATILWRLIRQGYITSHGVFLNIDKMIANPINV